MNKTPKELIAEFIRLRDEISEKKAEYGFLHAGKSKALSRRELTDIEVFELTDVGTEDVLAHDDEGEQQRTAGH